MKFIIEQRCAALGRNRLDNSITVRRIHSACMGHITLHGIGDPCCRNDRS
mgnify:CR=1 FL=1